jgi:hypothetical protein
MVDGGWSMVGVKEVSNCKSKFKNFDALLTSFDDCSFFNPFIHSSVDFGAGVISLYAVGDCEWRDRERLILWNSERL